MPLILILDRVFIVLRKDMQLLKVIHISLKLSISSLMTLQMLKPELLVAMGTTWTTATTQKGGAKIPGF